MRFYTTPPKGVKYPWLFVNFFNYKLLFMRKFDHAIMDSGVEKVFHHGKLTEYPEGFLQEYKDRAQRLAKSFGDRLWVVIPDYPDDYRPGEIGNNVSKTIKNIQNFISDDGVNWLPVIQARYLDPFSLFESCQRTREIIGDYPHIAIGTVCKTNSVKYIAYACRVVRKYFPNSWIHAFGLTLSALKKVALDSFDSMAWSYHKIREYDIKKGDSWRRKVLDSFDSMNYTFPRKPHNPTAKSEQANEAYFHAYLARIDEILGKSLGG